MKKRIVEWMKWKPSPSGIPNWAWCITWGIMISGIVLNVICIVGLLKR